MTGNKENKIINKGVLYNEKSVLLEKVCIYTFIYVASNLLRMTAKNIPFLNFKFYRCMLGFLLNQ